MSETKDARVASAIDGIADRYLQSTFELDPESATGAGVPGFDDRWTDYSREGAAARTELARATLAELDTVEPVDDVDRVTAAAMRERLGLLVELDDADLSYGRLRVIASPAQMREVFDLAPTATEENWRDIATRLNTLPAAIEGYLSGLREAQRRGTGPALRQVEATAEACERYADPRSGFFADYIAEAAPGGAAPSQALAADLAHGAAEAARAYGHLVEVLRTEFAPQASTRDAVGRDQYRLWSRVYLGAAVDLAETYQWGLEELARIEAEMASTAERIVGRPDVAAAVEALDADPARRLQGTEALQRWMQVTSNEAVAELGREHFDIPEQIHRLDCMIAPTQEGGIYYTAPSEDFSRPGQMWWSVPEGVTEFTTWQEKTTVYHEGVPGHHLQIGQTLVRAETLNRWRRMGCWVSGHGEGWALYAERLMAELGFLDDPGDRLGMLDMAAFRAARVVVDIGTHCELPAPTEVGGGTWDADKMWTFLTGHCRIERNQLRFEQLRYLGWPGQAPSYKVGERLWRQIRDQASEREDFDLKAFHRQALDLGSVGLDVLRQSLT